MSSRCVISEADLILRPPCTSASAFADMSQASEHHTSSACWNRTELCVAPSQRALPIRGYKWSCSSAVACSEAPPPLVAHCAAGLMRSFLEPVIHRSYKHNLLHALGGRAALFLQLKTFDVQPKRDRKGKNCISMGCTFPAEVSEDVIPATFGPSEHAKVAAVMDFLQPQAAILMHAEQPQYNPRCHMGTSSNGTILNAYKTAAGTARHVGQLESSLACLSMLEAHEVAHGLAFDWVTRARPDLAFLAPLPPLAAFVARATGQNGALAFFSQKDYFYVFARNASTPILGVVSHYRACNGRSWWSSAMEYLLRGSAMKADVPFREVQLPLGVVKAFSAKSCARRPCQGAVTWPATLPARMGQDIGSHTHRPASTVPCCLSGLSDPRELTCGDSSEMERFCRQIAFTKGFRWEGSASGSFVCGHA